MTSLLCHPEAKPKGLLWRFFGRLRSLRMTRKGADAVLSEAKELCRKQGDSSLTLRMTRKDGQNDRKNAQTLS